MKYTAEEAEIAVKVFGVIIAEQVKATRDLSIQPESARSDLLRHRILNGIKLACNELGLIDLEFEVTIDKDGEVYLTADNDAAQELYNALPQQEGGEQTH